MMEQMKKNYEETEAQLKKILTAEQYKIYQDNQKKRMQARPQGPRGPQRGNRGGGYPRN